MEKNTALSQVHTLNNQVKNLSYDLREAVVNAVMDHGATWPEIGAMLGISKQTAHARYAGAVAAERRDRKWAEENPEKYAAAVAKGKADAAATLAEIHERVWKSSPSESKISDPDVAGTSETPSIFSDSAEPVQAQETAVQFPTDPTCTVDPGEPGPESRIICPFCRSSVGRSGRKGHEQAVELFRGEHAQFGSGDEATCGHMVKHNLTKPYYDDQGMPWASGWKSIK